jgi:hypothetical protein
MNFADHLFEVAKANTDAARVAYEAGYKSGFQEGWKAAVAEAVKILNASKQVAP